MTSSWIHQRWEISRAATRPPTRAGAAAFVLVLAIAWSAVFSTASAQAPTGAGVQIFTQIVGTTPDWQEMSLTLSRLEVSGQDANGRRYTVTAFEGSHTVTIPRSAEGLARFVAAGATIPGRIDQVRLTIADAAITVSASDPSTSPRVIPVVFTDDALLVQAPRPLSVAAGQTRSLVTPLRLGIDAVLARDGRIAVRPTVAASLLATVRPENFLNGDEILIDGPSEEFPELGITAMRAKALDPTTTSIRDVIVHGGTGALVSLSDLHAQNEAAWRSAHGVLDRELVQRLESLGSTDVVAADVWVDVPGPATFLGTATTASALDVQHTAFLEERRAAAQPILDGLRSTLEAAGATIVGVDSSPAVIRIQATPPVLEQVAHMATVLQVSQTRLTTGDVISTDSATDLMQQPLQLAHALGAGRDLRIGIVEPEACIRTTHEAFQFVTFEEAVGGCGASGIAARGGHSTAVAGALAAFIPPSPFPNPGRPEAGLAGLFGGRILSHNNCSIPPAMIARNPHLVNFSCTDDGWLDGKDPYMDYAVYTHRIFVANGSGNLVADGPQDLPVYCPSYNSVCVGGYNHLGTVGRGNWGDDIPGGRWRNPLRTGREKPDLVGPTGDRLPSYQGDTRYESRGGTSFSTPFVVGTAGLLMANFPQKLLGNPTLTRAALLASATHSIPGQQPVALINDGVDDKTGAGAPRGDRALQILDDDKFVTAFIDRGRDFDSSGYLTIPLPNFGASPGEKVRVVMTYDHCQVETVSMPERLQADLDLIVYGNGVVRSNSSHVDNTEIVEFTATEQTGISMRVRVQYWDPCFDGSRKTHFAIAWDRLSPEVQ